jgi:dynein heavy chain
MEPQDACEKLRLALKVLGGFKLQYLSYKSASGAECPANPWRFQNGVVFGRLDTFMQRCADMVELQSTFMQVRVVVAGECACGGVHLRRAFAD